MSINIKKNQLSLIQDNQEAVKTLAYYKYQILNHVEIWSYAWTTVVFMNLITTRILNKHKVK